MKSFIIIKQQISNMNRYSENKSSVREKIISKEIAADEFYPTLLDEKMNNNNRSLRDEDYLVIGGFLKEDIKKYEIGFGIIDKDNREVTDVKSINLNENNNLAVFIYNCTLDLGEVVGKDVILKNKKSEIIWVGKVRTIPRKNLLFSKHSKGTCYICDRVINKNTIENKSTAAIAILSSNDKIFSVLNIKSGDAQVKNKAKEVINDKKKDSSSNEKIVSTELKHYIGDKSEEITKKIINDVINLCPIEIKNRKKTDSNLDKYIKISILANETVITINQNNDIETVISCGKDVISLERILGHAMCW